MTARLKIAILGPTHPFRGGIAHHTTMLYRQLRERHDVRMIGFRRQYPMWLYPAASDRDPSEKPFTADGVERVLDSLNPLTWLQVVRQVRRFDPDALVIPWWVAFWALPMGTISRLARRNRRTRVVFICHNVVEHESSRLRQLATRFALSGGDRFVVHSDEDRDNLLALIPRAQVVRAELPSFGAIATERPSRDAARTRLGLDPAEPILLFFGFVRPYKGLRHALDALPQILARFPVRLIVAGEFWRDRDSYLAQIARLGIAGQVVLLDRYVANEQVPDLFAAADLVVQPYETATQSAVTQIAFDAGRPVVVTSVGGLPETVRHGGTGYVVPPRDSVAIAGAVVDFFENARAESMQAEILREADRFSWPRFTAVLEKAISD